MNMLSINSKEAKTDLSGTYLRSSPITAGKYFCSKCGGGWASCVVPFVPAFFCHVLKNPSKKCQQGQSKWGGGFLLSGCPK
jgi:hypothetical protein